MQHRAAQAVCYAILVLCGVLTAADLGRLVHHPAAPPAVTRVVAASASPPVPLGPPVPPPTIVTTTTTAAPTTTTLAPRYFAPVASRSAPLPAPTTTTSALSVDQSSGYSTGCYPAMGMAPRNGTEACISARENGGCYGAGSNPSHAGRWQLSESLFYHYGGTGSWRYASPAMQDQVFRNIVAADGYGNWTPYDGC